MRERKGLTIEEDNIPTLCCFFITANNTIFARIVVVLIDLLGLNRFFVIGDKENSIVVTDVLICSD